MAIAKRIEGGEQPHIPLFGGFLKLRIPFVHYSWSWQDQREKSGHYRRKTINQKGCPLK